VFDCLDFLEEVLFDTYSGHKGSMARMVKQIIKRKGPRKS